MLLLLAEISDLLRKRVILFIMKGYPNPEKAGSGHFGIGPDNN